VLTDGELDALAARCAARGAALILDEVFADYPLRDGREGSEMQTAGSDLDRRGRGATVRATAPRGARPLVFRLGGLSKSAGLPQLKLGWIAVDGPDDLRDAALERLEVICDTYLSVSTPVQVAAPTLLAEAGPIRTAILDRVRGNYARLRALAARHPAVEVLNADAGWSAVLRVPATKPEEDLVLDLLEHDAIVVHPGFFFDFAHEAFLVVSLLPEPACFSEGIRRIVERLDG
jgi:aspartate/methionine/tyrosine aminotransferase